MPAKLNTNTFINKSIAKFGEFLDYSCVLYVNARSLVELICPIHGSFYQQANTHLQAKFPCPSCGKKLLTTSLFINNAKKIHGDKFDYSKSNFIYLKSKIHIICSIHGLFITTPASHLRGSCGGCSKCANHEKLTTEKFIKKAGVIHGNKYDYSLVNYINNSTKVKIICKIHSIFEQSPSNHYKYGCLFCSGKYLKTTKWFISVASERHNYLYDYSKTNYTGMFVNVIITCNNHGDFNALPTNHLHGRRGCPKCSDRISKNEVEWLNSLGLPDDSKHRNVYFNISGKRYFVDGFDPINNIVYEFNGDYWHGNPSIYNSDAVHPETKLTYGEMHTRTLNKYKTITGAGFKIISIWESDYLNGLRINQ